MNETKIPFKPLAKTISIDDIVVEQDMGCKIIETENGDRKLVDDTDNITHCFYNEDDGIFYATFVDINVDVHEIKQKIVNIYNDELIKDRCFLALYTIYVHHVRRYRKGDCVMGLIDNTPQGYFMYIHGLQRQLRNYINIFINEHLGTNIPITFDDVKFE